MDQPHAVHSPAKEDGPAETENVKPSELVPAAVTPPPQPDSVADPPLQPFHTPDVPEVSVSATASIDAISPVPPPSAAEAVSAPEFKDNQSAELGASTGQPVSLLSADHSTSPAAAHPDEIAVTSADENTDSLRQKSSSSVIVEHVLPSKSSSPVSSSPPPLPVRPSSSLTIRQPPPYSSVEHLRPQRSHVRSTLFKPNFRSSGIAFRPLRFAPPMRPPPYRNSLGDGPRLRDFRDFAVPPRAITEFTKNQTVGADTLAKISELAEITRASIPMPPLEDEHEGHSVPSSSSKDSVRLSATASVEVRQASTSNGRALPSGSPAGAAEDRIMPNSASHRDQYSATASRAGAQLGIQVEVVHSISPVPPPSSSLHRSRFLAIKESNLGFVNFSSAVAFLSLDETPLNPLEIESSKDILISIFGPKMTLYRCGGCDSTFIFRNIFSDHFYRGIVPYRLRCQHCRDTIIFHNICQVKDHVKSHGFKTESCRGFMLTVGEYSDDAVKFDKDAPNEAVIVLDDNHDSADSPADGSKSSEPVPSHSIASNTQLGRILTHTSPDSVIQTRNTISTSRERERNIHENENSEHSPAAVNNKRPEMHVNEGNVAQAISTRESQTNALQAAKDKAAFLHIQRNVQNLNLQNARSAPAYGRHGPTISVGQVLEREFFSGPGSSPNGSRPPGACDCIFCNARFDSQSGLTHHFQRCKDVVRAGLDFHCPECEVVCCNPCSFQAHKHIHQIRRTGVLPAGMCCPECGLRLRHIEEIKSHVERRCVHWCRILCCSYSCVVPNCGYHVTNEDDMLLHVALAHAAANGRNVCPVCKVQAGSGATELIRHLRSFGLTCRERLLQQKSHFFAYRCNYCVEREAPVFETKAVMRDHIFGSHPEDGTPASGLVGLLTAPETGPARVRHPDNTAVPGGEMRPAGKKIRIAGEQEEVVSYQSPATHRETSTVRCVFCGDKGIVVPNLKTVDDLEAHLYGSHVARTYPTTCFHCGKTLNSAQEMLGHLLQQVLRLPVTRCDECDFVTLTSSGIVQHKIAFHQQRQMRPFVCELCRKAGFVSQALLLDHRNKVHTIEGSTQRSDPSGSGLHPALDPVNAHNSRMQSSMKRAVDQEYIQQRKQLRVPPLNCRSCDFQCDSQVVMLNHMSRHDERTKSSEKDTAASRPTRHACKVCEAQQSRFVSFDQTLFYEHVRREHPAKEASFQCSECALQLLSLPALQKHLRAVHTIFDPVAFLIKSPFYTSSKMVRVGVTLGAGSNQPTMHQAGPSGFSVDPGSVNRSGLDMLRNNQSSMLKLRVTQPSSSGYSRISAVTDSTSAPSNAK